MDTELIYCDDNLHRLAFLQAASADLIYLDPPFFSNRTYEVIWGDEAEVRSFQDRWEGGIHHYVAWMRERVVEMWRVLKPTGSLYLHCDWHASHYLKVMLDEVCGHEWLPRDRETDVEPKVCPKCKSPYWNVPRRTPKAAADGD